MKRFIVMFTIVLSSASIDAAQKLANDGVVLTGTVLGVESACVDGKPAVELRLYLQFRNDNGVPLLLIGPSFNFTTKVNFVTTELGSADTSGFAADVVRYNPYLENPYSEATKEDYDPLIALAWKSDGWQMPEPIEPGGYYEYQHTLWLRNGFRIKGKSIAEQKLCGRPAGTPVPEYPAFHLAYHFSMKKYDHGADLLRTLQSRWKRSGHLPLDSNGDVSYKSEKIIFERSK